MRIIPRDYKPVAISIMEAHSNNRNKDLSPTEMLTCLNQVRTPIDESFRRNARKGKTFQKDKNGNGAGAKQVSTSEPKPQGNKRKPKPNNRGRPPIEQLINANLAPATKKADKKPGKTPSQKAQSNKDKQRSAKNASSSPSGCQLCGYTKHDSEHCPFYPQSKRTVATNPCTVCNTGLHHYGRDCKMHTKASKN